MSVYLSWCPLVRVSQHFFDPYSFCHILHGFIFYGLWGWWPELVWGRAWWWVWLAGAGLAVLAELCHEIIENSEWVIQLYRSNSGTSSQYEVPTLPRLYNDYATTEFLAWRLNKLSAPIVTTCSNADRDGDNSLGANKAKGCKQ